jgi:hypothetical protein
MAEAEGVAVAGAASDLVEECLIRRDANNRIALAERV